MTEQLVNIEVDGRTIQARAGAMLIEATDAAGIAIPRFCYHKKLSVSANCRMCLVEVEKVPRPLPACATPVAEGMKVRTRSPMALEAQKGTMEFLLINHPLDCPICDQGGECELQDLAVGYGRDVSRFVEGKRVVADRDIGPLVATDLTRCIHCTRCVRFGAEIAGVRELGATGRGEHMTIGMYVARTLDSELSGNVIDVCPVGSLTSKPFRFKARAWELVQRDSIAPHDGIGSNLHLHVKGNRVMRVHPRENEGVNECWISDRDRFSYEGLYSADRLTRPMVKTDGAWRETEWSIALQAAAATLKGAGSELAALVSPSATTEELYLAQKLVRGLGSDAIDFRLRQADFRGPEPAMPWLGMSLPEVESLNAVLVIGANPRKELPLFNHRLRKAVMEGAQIFFVNPYELDLNYPAHQVVVSPAGMAAELDAIARGAKSKTGRTKPGADGANEQAIREAFKADGRNAIFLGSMAMAHPDWSVIRGQAHLIAEATGATVGYLAAGANALGARVARALPADDANAGSLFEESRKGYLLLGVEPDRDLWNPARATKALKASGAVVALTAYRTAALEEVAQVMLPIGLFAETSGTFINLCGEWQSFNGATQPPGEARPGWKVLRVLGNEIGLKGFDHVDSGQVLAEVREAAKELVLENACHGGHAGSHHLGGGGVQRIGDVPIHAVDALVRRAGALQQTRDAVAAAVRVNVAEAGRLGLQSGGLAAVTQEGSRILLPVEIDETIPDGCVRIPAGLEGVEHLGGQFGPVTVEAA